jgi:uroporphyrinogen-III synthase
LRGRRILLLSTEPSAPLRYTRSDGAEVVSLRSLLIVPRSMEIARALPRLEAAKTLVFSSKHAVDALLAGVGVTGRDARAVLSNTRVAAVGKATAERLARHHLRVDWVGEAGGAELAEELLKDRVEGPVLHLRAADGRPELVARLQAAGIESRLIVAYDAVPDTTSIGRAIRRHQVQRFDAIGFTSPKGAGAFIAASGIELLSGVLLGAIGATTTSALAKLGLTAVTARTPDLTSLEERLAAGLADFLGIG